MTDIEKVEHFLKTYPLASFVWDNVLEQYEASAEYPKGYESEWTECYCSYGDSIISAINQFRFEHGTKYLKE